MDISLKPLDEQVVVITGASSGIGLATALAAAQQGARLVLAARSKQTLDEIVERIGASGGEAVAVEADVGVRADVERIARVALERFGRIDTWINDAGISVYGRLDEVSDEDSQRVFQTNFWGVVYGSLVAVPHLKAAGGGALINVGSEASDAAVPLQGMYSASKHAVKGFTHALRIELDADKAPVSVTLIQPTAVDTPFPEHAGNYLSQEPKLPTPMIDPDKVAAAILDAATESARDVRVGAMSVINTTTAKVLPALGEAMAKMQIGRQQRAEPPHSREGSLYRAGESGRVRGRGNQNAADPAQARRANVRDGGLR
ncbi:SDR family oxidoreductase [Pigmentiphaga soli]|uniref:SDR family oxidoreductase n=1 Tax=Pigmentiphaga soli TaxID=1007095 RepID=A0ABP8GPJ7_9BURK